jgi:hypothetical protein
MSDRDLVFFSYRHDKDGEKWLAALRGMLEPYVLGDRLIAWSDKDIRTGELWHSRIQGAIGRSRVAVLLVNQRFFGSAYIREHELPRLVADALAAQLTLVCIPIGPYDGTLAAQHRLDALQFGLDPKSPLSELKGSKREQALVALAMKIKDAYNTASASATAGTGITTATSIAPPAAACRLGTAPALAAVATHSSAPPGSAPPMAPLLDVPPLDTTRYVARAEELAAIRRHLLDGGELALGLSSQGRGLGLHGMGGMGKSVMALYVCHDDAVRRVFADGVAWVSVGQKPDLLALQNRLLHLLDPAALPAERSSDARTALAAAVAGKRVLIVIDDLWNAEHFSTAFDFVSSGADSSSRLLITTRDAAVLARIGARTQALQRMPDALARRLLALRSNCTVEALPAQAADILDECAGLPLAIALAGAQIADGVSWPTLAGQMRQGRIDFLDHDYGSIYASLGRSVDALPEADRERYIELAVFPEDTAIAQSVIARLWQHSGGLSAAQTEKLLARLDRKALLMLNRPGVDDTATGAGAGSPPGSQATPAGAEPTIALHDLQQDFVRLRADNMAALHARLLDAYRASLQLPEGPAGWAALPPDEPYLRPQLAAHLIAAGRQAELDDA